MGVPVVTAAALPPTPSSEFVADAEMRGRVLGVRMPVEDEDADEPWRMTPSRRREASPIDVAMPSKIGVVVADQVYIDRTELPSAMTARLIRLAAFQNPEFYRAQSMRFPDLRQASDHLLRRTPPAPCGFAAGLSR